MGRSTPASRGLASVLEALITCIYLKDSCPAEDVCSSQQCPETSFWSLQPGARRLHNSA